MVLTLVIMAAAIVAFSGALKSREFQSARTDALVSAQAALNVMSREIGNSGYGLVRDVFGSNGLVLNNCTGTRIHFRSNVNNTNLTTDVGEDVTYYYDDTTDSVVRHDPNASPTTSGIINKVSQVEFIYHNYAADGTSTPGAASEQTGRVTVRLTVLIAGPATNSSDLRNVTVESDVTLRNSPYGLGQF
jgi:hypothetical protein